MMKGKLTFRAAEVVPLIEHARSCSRHKLTFAEREAIYGEECLYAQPNEEARGSPGLWLDKDHGVYMMSNGVPDQWPPGRSKGCRVAFAAGFHPDKDDFGTWWNEAEELLGPDDFTERIEIAPIETQIATSGKVEIAVVGEDFRY